MSKAIAFFDFDGTITNRDSLKEFIKFAVGVPKYYIGLIGMSPYLALFVLKLMPNYKAKEKLLSFFFRGWSVDRFQSVADEFSSSRIDTILKKSAVEKIRWHQDQKHTVVVVSASLENWLQKWCITHNLALIGTQIATSNGLLTGKFKSKNCYGPEKVSRIQKKYDLTDYQQIYAYGDSRGDKEMLAMSNHPFYRTF